jgi:dihydrofolate reductase
MKTLYYTACSLDGFIADPEHSLDWLLQFGEPEGNYFAEFLGNVGAIAMGSTTYEWVLNHPMPGEDGEPVRWPYTQPAWIFSSRELPGIDGADIRFVRGDVRPVHEAMRVVAADRDIWIVGGGELAGQFLDHGLLDEIRVSIASVTLGQGVPVLPRRFTTPPLRLISAQQYGESFVDLRYEVPRR